MDEQRYSTSGQDWQGFAKIAFVDRGEFVDPRRHQKTLEAANARLDELFEVRGVARHDAAPERDVYMTLPARCGSLGLERCRGRRRRHAVQRHVDDRRDATGRRRPRRGVEPLPIGAARLVDMDMGVNDARRDDEVAGVVAIVHIAPVFVRSDASDRSVLDVDRGRADTIRQDDSAATYYHR